MEVHEVVYNAALEVVFDVVDDDAGSNVDDLDVGHIFFVLLLVDGLIHFLIVSYSIAKVFGCCFRVLTFVVR